MFPDKAPAFYVSPILFFMPWKASLLSIPSKDIPCSSGSRLQETLPLQRTSVTNVWGQLSQLEGEESQAKNAAKYPTMHRQAPHNKASGPRCQQCRG